MMFVLYNYKSYTKGCQVKCGEAAGQRLARTSLWQEYLPPAQLLVERGHDRLGLTHNISLAVRLSSLSGEELEQYTGTRTVHGCNRITW